MARKVVFDENIILEKTKCFIKEKGIDAMNARDLCKYIGCSTQPLFKNFENMDIFKKRLKKYLHDYYDDFILKIVDKNNYLYTISYAYALYAKLEYNIFKSLFITELAGTRTIKEVLNTSWNIPTIEAMTKQYNISLKKAEEVYRDVRFYTHGISSQLCAKTIKINNKEIENLIKEMINKCLK